MGEGVFPKPELKFWNGYGAYPKNKICAVALRQHIGCPTDKGHILHRYESSVHRLMGGGMVCVHGRVDIRMGKNICWHEYDEK